MINQSIVSRIGLLSCFALAMLSNSCKESNGNPTPEESGSFIEKQWKVESMTISPAIDWDADGDLDSDILAVTEECDRDNLIVFEKDQKTTTIYRGVKCDEDEPDKEVDGSWKYDEASKKLVITDDDEGDEEWTVLKSDASTLKMEVILPNVTPKHTVTMTLKSVK